MLNPRSNISDYIMLIKPYIRLYIGRLISSLKQLNRSGQALEDYGMILAIVALALGAMQFYVQRGLQGRYKSAADYSLRQIFRAKRDFRFPAQYDPYYNKSTVITESKSKIRRSYSETDATETKILNPGQTKKEIFAQDPENPKIIYKTIRSGEVYELPYSEKAVEVSD